MWNMMEKSIWQKSTGIKLRVLDELKRNSSSDLMEGGG